MYPYLSAKLVIKYDYTKNILAKDEKIPYFVPYLFSLKGLWTMHIFAPCKSVPDNL